MPLVGMKLPNSGQRIKKFPYYQEWKVLGNTTISHMWRNISDIFMAAQCAFCNSTPV